MAFNLDNYVPVEDRIERFYEKHPEGSIQTELAHLSDHMVVVKAYAYRSPDDPRPATGHSQLNIPGTTSFTKGSEVENAETSAVGRALAMMGFEVRKGVASRQEVRGKGVELPPMDAPPAKKSVDVVWWDEFRDLCSKKAVTAASLAEVLGEGPTLKTVAAWMDREDEPFTKLVILAEQRQKELMGVG